jgi:putative heme-binding domain-containing protein
MTVLFFVGSSFAQEEKALVEKGQKLYTEKKCSICHKIDGVGGKIGPDLSDVGNRRDAEWIKRFLKAPKSVNPETKMPPFKGTDEELEPLVSYLMSLKK